MGFVSLLEDIDEKIETCRHLESAAQDPEKPNPNREAEIRRLLHDLRRTCSEIISYVELATDPSCEFADELMQARQTVDDLQAKVAQLEMQISEQASTIREREDECQKLAKRLTRLTEQFEDNYGRNPEMAMEPYLTPERRARHKPNP